MIDRGATMMQQRKLHDGNPAEEALGSCLRLSPRLR